MNLILITRIKISIKPCLDPLGFQVENQDKRQTLSSSSSKCTHSSVEPSEREKETGAEGHRTKEGEVGRNVSMLTLVEMLPMGK